MPRKNTEVEKLLQAKFDFTPDPSREKGHRWYKLQLAGLPAIRTFFSHGKRELSANLEAKIARQLRVSAAYFSGMMDCRNGRNDYYVQVRKNPVPRFYADSSPD